MQCPHCHAINPEQAKFCLNCGSRLVIFCSLCGTRLPLHARFCFECGAQLVSPPTAAQAAPPQFAVQPAPPQTAMPEFAPQPAPPQPAAVVVPPVAPVHPAVPQQAPAPVPEAPVEAPTAAAAPESDPAWEQLQRLMPREYIERLLATKGQAVGERRIVSILFSDIKGSTAMAEQLDPEEVMEIINGAFEVLIKPIYKYEGTLARLMGDAILAFFGAPIAHEDDAERAIRAGLEIVEGAQSYAARLAEERGIRGFNVRVGINTGLVVMGEVGSDMRVEYTAMGDAINLAARMEQNAPIGGILISRDTYQHVRGIFEVQAQPPLAVKGKAEPVQTYVVVRAKPRTFRLATRGVAGVETRMVGREAELKQLQDAFYLAAEDRERQMQTVSGESGVGKSRLLYEFESWLEEQPGRVSYLRGRADQELQNVPYALLRDVFSLHWQIQESDPPQIVRQKVEGGVSEFLGRGGQSQMKAHFIGQLLGFDFSDSPHLQNVLDDARQLHDRALIYLGEFFQGITALSTTVLMLEDIHWADDSSLDAANQLALALPDQSLLILCLARPLLFDRRPHWGEGQTFHGRLELQPLSKRDSRRLVEEILQKMEQIPAALREMVVSGAEGNPLYVEELIKMLLEEEVIVREEARWLVQADRLAEMHVPPTLTGVLQARLDSLPLEQRVILQQASVVGRTFWDRVVVRIGEATGEGLEEQKVPLVLSALRGREMVAQRETSTFAGTREFIFGHAALREVAYGSILKRVRRGYHALVAEWLIEQSGQRVDEYTGLIAEHLDLAGQPERALPYLRQAGDQAAAQYANAEAVRHLSRALELLADGDAPETAAERYAILLARQKVYHLRGERQAQAQDVTALRELAEVLDAAAAQPGVSHRAEAALHCAGYYEAISDLPAALNAAQEAAYWAEQSADLGRKAEALIKWGIVLWRQGKFPEAHQRLEEALDLSQQRGDRTNEATSLHNLGTVAYLQGNLDGARVLLEEALSIRKDQGDRRREAQSLNNLVAVYHGLGDILAAKTCTQQALTIYQTIGDRLGEALVLNNLAQLHQQLGDLAAARGYYERSLPLQQAIGDRRGEALALKNMGLALHDLGDDQTARQYCEGAVAIDRETGNRKGEGYSLTYLGLVLEGLGELQLAGTAYAEALQLRREIGQEALAIDDLAGLARVAQEQSQLDRALDYVQEALAWIAEHGVQGIDYPLRVYLAAADVLGAVGQTERAAEILASAQDWVQERAGLIHDEDVRRAFLEDVPLHKQLWEQMSQLADAPAPLSVQN